MDRNGKECRDAVAVYPAGNWCLVPVRDAQFASCFSAWCDAALQLDARGTHFGFVRTGSVALAFATLRLTLQAGMYFSVPGACTVTGIGEGFVATRVDYRGFFQVGGPIEETGRLRYIDGCSDSLLLSPVVYGDPCLNLLYLPPHTLQTEHTHPSCRLGRILPETARGDAEGI